MQKNLNIVLIFGQRKPVKKTWDRKLRPENPTLNKGGMSGGNQLGGGGGLEVPKNNVESRRQKKKDSKKRQKVQPSLENPPKKKKKKNKIPERKREKKKKGMSEGMGGAVKPWEGGEGSGCEDKKPKKTKKKNGEGRKSQTDRKPTVRGESKKRSIKNEAGGGRGGVWGRSRAFGRCGDRKNN